MTKAQFNILVDLIKYHSVFIPKGSKHQMPVREQLKICLYRMVHFRALSDRHLHYLKSQELQQRSQHSQQDHHNLCTRSISRSNFRLKMRKRLNLYKGNISIPDGINDLVIYNDGSIDWLTFSKRRHSSFFVVKIYHDGKATIAIRTDDGNNTHKYFMLSDGEYFLDYKDYGDDKVRFRLESF
ncbi:hypothetical protein BGZ47_007993 [Haplosporangium gracile]|nr:hypothetical protein BGZ47_007993 [Haplosporangium gracile]